MKNSYHLWVDDNGKVHFDSKLNRKGTLDVNIVHFTPHELRKFETSESIKGELTREGALRLVNHLAEVFDMQPKARIVYE